MGRHISDEMRGRQSYLISRRRAAWPGTSDPFTLLQF